MLHNSTLLSSPPPSSPSAPPCSPILSLVMQPIILRFQNRPPTSFSVMGTYLKNVSPTTYPSDSYLISSSLTHTHAHACAHTHTHAHTHAHTRMHTHARMYTHTHKGATYSIGRHCLCLDPETPLHMSTTFGNSLLIQIMLTSVNNLFSRFFS